MQLTQPAKKFWARVPPEFRIKILNNIWCGICEKATGLGNITMSVSKGDLLISGTCMKCGTSLGRIVESD